MNASASRVARKVAVVSPADRPLGGDIARAMSIHGFDVALIGEDATLLRETVISVLHHGGRALALAVDGQERSTFSSALAQIQSRLGPVDVWIALDADCKQHPLNLGRGVSSDHNGLIADLYSWGLPEVAADMLRSDHGTVVVVESTLAFLADGHRTAECAAAFARRGYVESLRRVALERSGSMRVSAVYTGFPDPASADVESVTRHRRQTARLVVRSACDGRRQRVVGARTWLAVTTARLFPGTIDHLSAGAATSSAAATQRLDWSVASHAIRARWREMVFPRRWPV